jgi:hypothetical protein
MFANHFCNQRELRPADHGRIGVSRMHAAHSTWNG